MFLEIEATSALWSQRVLGAERKKMFLTDSLFIQASKSQPRKRVKKRLKMKFQQRRNLPPSKIGVLYFLFFRVVMNLILLLSGETILIVYQLLVFIILPRTKEN